MNQYWQLSISLPRGNHLKSSGEYCELNSVLNLLFSSNWFIQTNFKILILTDLLSSWKFVQSIIEQKDSSRVSKNSRRVSVSFSTLERMPHLFSKLISKCSRAVLQAEITR